MSRESFGSGSIVAMGHAGNTTAFWDVFSEDLVAPEVRSTWGKFEHRLMAAALSQAVRDCETLAAGFVTDTNRARKDAASEHRRERVEMLEWIEGGTLDWPFSLRSICEHLGFDLEGMQRRLRAVLDGQAVPRTWRVSDVGRRHKMQDTREMARRKVEAKRAQRARGGK